MLIQFAVTNYRSIRERQVLSLIASNYDKKLPDALIDAPLSSLPKAKFLKGVAIYGPNASGKSNLLAALAYLANFVRQSMLLEPEAPTGVEPFALDAEAGVCATEFELDFSVRSVHYSYLLKLTSQKILEECLLIREKKHDRVLFHRIADDSQAGYAWQSPAEITNADLQSRVRPNNLFLSVAAYFNEPGIKSAYHWFRSDLRFINNPVARSVGWRSEVVLKSTRQWLGDPNMRPRIVEMMRSADVGISDIEVREVELSVEDQLTRYPSSLHDRLRQEGQLKPHKRVDVRLHHKGSGAQTVPMPMDTESAGTQRFFTLLGPWLDALDSGDILVIDEIETSLHPTLVRELVAMLMSKEHNPQGAQLIFTTHDALLLSQDLLRRDQVWLTEKSAAGKTRLFPLSDFKVRNDEALTRGYLAGRYGGIPLIPKGFK